MLNVKANRRFGARQEGLTMIETLIALVIGLLVIGVVFIIFNQVQGSQNVSTAKQNIGTLRSGVDGLFQNQKDYTNLTDTVAINAKIPPSSMVTTGGALKDVWGGAVTLQADTVNGNSAQFDIVYNGLPQSACMKLGQFSRGSWAAATINGTAVTGTVSDASSNCASGSGNTITYVSN